jgi:hypothetical protein
MNDLASTAPPPAATSGEVLQGALIDSRHRWRELVHLAADFAYETDEWGRFTLISPDPALDWAANALIGQPSAALLADGGAMFDPFRVTAKVRHRQAWLKRGDGTNASLSISATPIHDPNGRIIGARGVGIDMTEIDSLAAQTAGALRRAEVMDHILWRVGQEVMPGRMIDAALDVLANVTGAEGVAVVIGPTSVDDPDHPFDWHRRGTDGAHCGSGSQPARTRLDRSRHRGDADNRCQAGVDRAVPDQIRRKCPPCRLAPGRRTQLGRR